MFWTALLKVSLSVVGIRYCEGAQPSLPSVLELPARDDRTWSSMRMESQPYVDKTAYLERLLDDYPRRHYFFLTRPPGFGKSSFLDMTEHFFRGHKHLFEGTRIYAKGNAAFIPIYKYDVVDDLKGRKWLEYPVIRLNFGQHFVGDLDAEDEDCEKIYTRQLENIARSYSLDGEEWLHRDNLHFLIGHLRRKFNLPVVLLIDEFDAPLKFALEVKKSKKLASQLTVVFGQLLRHIKSSLSKLRLVLITGVSRFEHDAAAPASAIKVYEDITYAEDFAFTFGFTADEIEANFKRYFVDEEKSSADERGDDELFVQKLKERCGGYNFGLSRDTVLPQTEIMNPLSVIKYIMRRKIARHPCLTGHSLDRIVRRFYSEQRSPDEFENGGGNFSGKSLVAKKRVADWFYESEEYKIREVPLELEMLLEGYLTIKAYYAPPPTSDEYSWAAKVTLAYPNKEVEEALKTRYASYIPSVDDFITNLVNWTDGLSENLKSGDIGAAMNTLQRYEYPQSWSSVGPSEWDVTRRLFTFVRSIPDIDCDQSLTFELPDSRNETAVIDLVTRNLPVNLVIKVKKDESATEGVKELFKYLVDSPESFRKAINDPERAYFVGINFQSKDGGILGEWIAVPYKNGGLRFDEAKASHTALLRADEYLEMMRAGKDK